MTDIAEGFERVEPDNHLADDDIAVLHLLCRLVLFLEFVVQTVVGGFKTGHFAAVASNEHQCSSHNHSGNF